MKNTVYQLVYKSCYHGEIYSDTRAVSISPPCTGCDILEIISFNIPDNDWINKNRHRFCGGVGSYFIEKEAAVAEMCQL